MSHRNYALGFLIVLTIICGSAAFGQIGPPLFMPSESRIQLITILGNQLGTDVIDAPFSAVEESMYSHRQSDFTLDNRSSVTTHFYRDGQGRTRAERYDASYNAETKSWLKSIYIADPVAGFLYQLNPENHKAVRLAWDARARELAAIRRQDISSTQSAEETAAIQEAESHATTESLGIRAIEGLQVEGYRQSLMISKGAIGNERSFEVKLETWISPELKLAIETTRDTGTTVRKTRLINIDRSEPDPALFRVPTNYRIEDGRMESAVAGGTAR